MLTSKFIHLHVPRTAGTTFRLKIAKHIDVEIIDKKAHQPYSYYANQCDEVPPAFTVIRNPWDWYVSMWGRANKIKHQGWKGSTFKEYMECVKNHDIDHWNFDTMTGAWETVEADRADYIGKYENLYCDLPRILNEIMGVDQGVIKQALASTRFRVTSHMPYQRYYDPMMRGWVRKWDRRLISYFQYTFDA